MGRRTNSSISVTVCILLLSMVGRAAAENLAINGGFETVYDTTGPRPTGYGYWRGNASEIVPTSQGITPFQGSQMLNFIYTIESGPALTKDSEVWQIIDIGSSEVHVSAGQAIASASFRFNRVDGDAETDTEFTAGLYAYAGDPCSFPSQYENSELAARLTSAFADSDPNTWELTTIDLVLPANTDFLVVEIAARENIFNDTSDPELDGHYADAVCATICSRPVIYVDTDANGANDGSSWADAFNYLQDGLAAAKYGDEIRVAEGIYKPNQNSLHPDGTGDRDATFQLVSGVAVRGGYAGFGEPDPNVRDTELYETILSGDLDGNDADVNEPSDLPSEPTRGENSYHIVTSISSNQTTLLDGFTVTGGNANSDGHWEGAGVYLSNSTVEIMNCSISGNKAFRGGGVLCRGGSPTIIHCTITGNVAGTKNSWDSRGGGILCSGSGPVITECIISENFTLGRWAEGGGIYGCGGPISNCTITGNWVRDRGGGLAFCTGPITNCTISNNTAHRDSGGLTFCDGPITNCTISGNCAQQEDTGGLGACDGPITNCIITGNWAARDAGAMGSCDGTIINCVITGNWAGRYGGGLRNAYGQPTLTNCTISGNSAVERGGAIYMRRSTLVLTNCIFSFNAASDGNEIALMLYSTMDVKYCDVAGGQTGIYIDSTSTINWGQGNMDVDPCFADVDSNDYRLRPGSPCIDAGDNNSVPSDTTDLDGDGNTTEPLPWDLDGKPRIVDGNSDGNSVVDMGAYEFFWPPIEV
ncbi:MAG: right-handed parallel beta-helix repeat-containing protein, partial [Planctomycetota bacterium]